MLKQTLGSIITAEPKQTDYDIVAKTLAPLLYKGLHTGEYTLTREAKHNNESPYENVELTKVLISASVSQREWQEVAYEVTSSYKDNNMNRNDYSLAVIRELLAIDESDEGLGLFSDVKLAMAFIIDSEERPVPVFVSIVDSPLEGNGEVQATLSFTLEDSLDDFTEAYNEDQAPQMARRLSSGLKVERFLGVDDFEW